MPAVLRAGAIIPGTRASVPIAYPPPAFDGSSALIKYLGSKRTLVPAILEAVSVAAPDLDTPSVLDLFSGTSRVGLALKNAGCRILANDHNAFAYTLATAYIQADADLLPEAARLIDHLNAIADAAAPPDHAAADDPADPDAEAADYFTETFCRRARYFHPRNGPRISAVRNEIARLAPAIGPELEAVLLVALLEAADRVDSTTGVQMAYLKQYAPRALRNLHLRLPSLAQQPPAGKCRAYCLDALDAARQLAADIAYIDPPYNQHSYLRNYHIWETLVRWDAPQHYGLACKRADCRTRPSPFNSRRLIHRAMADLIHAVQARVLIVSFNNEGYITRADMEQLLSTRGDVRIVEHDYRRYIGAQIGIYNGRGEKVGKVSHLRNKEYLYIVHCTASPAAALT